MITPGDPADPACLHTSSALDVARQLAHAGLLHQELSQPCLHQTLGSPCLHQAQRSLPLHRTVDLRNLPLLKDLSPHRCPVTTSNVRKSMPRHRNQGSGFVVKALNGVGGGGGEVSADRSSSAPSSTTCAYKNCAAAQHKARQPSAAQPTPPQHNQAEPSTAQLNPS